MAQTYKFRIKPPVGVMKVKSNQGFLRNLRLKIEQYLKNFVFYEEDIQIPIANESFKLMEVQKVYMIKFTGDQQVLIEQPKKEPKQVQKPVKQAVQAPAQEKIERSTGSTSQITVVDHFLNYATVIIVQSNSYLDAVRAHISIPNGYQSFSFLKGSIEISKVSQKNILISNLINNSQPKGSESTDPTLKIRFHKKEKFIQPSQRKNIQDTEAKDKIQKAQQTKQKVNDMIKQLEDFQNKFAQQTELKNNAKQQKLMELSKRLDQMNIPYTLKSDTDINEIISNLKKTKEQSQRLIDTLFDTKLQSINQLAAKFTGEVGIGLRGIQPVQSNSIDFALSKFQEDNSLNMLDSTDYDYSSYQAQSKHINKIQTKLFGGSISAMGGNPFFFLKTTAAYDTDTMGQSVNNQTKQYKNYYKNFVSLFAGKGLKLVEDNIELKDNVIRQYENLFKQSLIANNQDNFKIMTNEFFTKYGDRLQIGTFYFGNTFVTNLQVSFQEEQSLFSSRSIAQSALRVAIAGGGISQVGFGAAKAELTKVNKTGDLQKGQQILSKYSISSHNSSYPPVQDYNQWKEIVATNNNYWRIIGKDTENISILKLLRSNNTINRSAYLQTKTTKQIREFQRTLLSRYDPQQKTQQLSTRQFSENNFELMSSNIKNVLTPQIIEKVIVKRLSNVKDIVQSSQSYLQYKKGNKLYLVLKVECKRSSIQLVKNHLIKEVNQTILRVRSLLNVEVFIFLTKVYEIFKDQKQIMFYKCNIQINLVQTLITSLERFKNLKILTIYGRFPLYNSNRLTKNAQRLRERNINVYVTLSGAIPAGTNWTTYLDNNLKMLVTEAWM